MIWGWLIPGWLRRAVLGLGALALALLAAFGAGKREARRDAKAKGAKDHIDTRRRIDRAKGSTGDRADDIDWLRDFGDK